MPKSVNKVILVGNVGTASAVKYSASGTPIAEFSLATNERFKDRSGEWQERVEWHTIVAWQRLAEIVGEFVVTGAKVYIEGKLQTSSWEDRETGQTRYRTEIVARDLVLLGSRGNGTGDVQERHPDPAASHKTQPTMPRIPKTFRSDNDPSCSAS
jgi:single-strand DNA-binding protein